MTSAPLFALPLVACPHELLPLHIFEPRYRAMISWCLEQQAAGAAGEFVVACSSSSIIKKTGTLVKLLKVLKTYDDGRMDIVASAKRRVKLGDLEQDKPFPVVSVSVIEDETSDWDEALATEAFTLHRTIVQMVTGAQPPEKVYAGIADLSFLMASSIYLDTATKQTLIELRNEDERLKLVTVAMRQFVEQLEAVDMAARAIKGYWDLQKVFGGARG